MMKGANFDGDYKEKGKETYVSQLVMMNSRLALKIQGSN